MTAPRDAGDLPPESIERADGSLRDAASSPDAASSGAPSPHIPAWSRRDRGSTVAALPRVASFEERVGSIEAMQRGPFAIRRPLSDLFLRWLVVAVPLALSVVVGLIGLHFQRQSETYARGAEPVYGTYLDTLDELNSWLAAIAVVSLAVMALWSWLTITNTNRVCRSLRTPWFAAAGWLLVPGLAMIAHITLDEVLDAGTLIGVTVALAALYVPFGTLGGAAVDLGSKAHLVRVWYSAAVISAFMFTVGVVGSRGDLPTSNQEWTMQARAFACYLAALMLLVASTLAWAAAQELNAMIHHRWRRDIDPEYQLADPRSVRIMRRGRSPKPWLIPTLILRVVFIIGLAGAAVAAVGSFIWYRGRASRLTSLAEVLERQQLDRDFRLAWERLAIVEIALAAAYVVWAVVASINARRRSLLAPTPLAVIAAFATGPLVLVLSNSLEGPLGAAVLVIGLIVSVSGFLIGQMVLGRTVSALDGRGRSFIAWAVVIGAFNGVFALAAIHADERGAVLACGAVLAGLAFLACVVGWSSMSRLDRAVRESSPVGGRIDQPGEWSSAERTVDSFDFTSSHN